MIFIRTIEDKGLELRLTAHIPVLVSALEPVSEQPQMPTDGVAVHKTLPMDIETNFISFFFS